MYGTVSREAATSTGFERSGRQIFHGGLAGRLGHLRLAFEAANITRANTQAPQRAFGTSHAAEYASTEYSAGRGSDLPQVTNPGWMVGGEGLEPPTSSV